MNNVSITVLVSGDEFLFYNCVRKGPQNFFDALTTYISLISASAWTIGQVPELAQYERISVCIHLINTSQSTILLATEVTLCSFLFLSF